MGKQIQVRKNFVFIKENSFLNVKKGKLETHFHLGRMMPYFIFDRYFFQFPIYYGGKCVRYFIYFLVLILTNVTP